MRLQIRFVLLAVTTLTTITAIAAAEPGWPDPSHSISSLDATNRLLIAPWSGSEFLATRFTVEVRDAENVPVGNAEIEVLIDGIADGRTHLCAGAQRFARTNSQGIAVLNIPGSGCMKAHWSASIRANGIIIREYPAVMSLDYSGSDDAGQPFRWNGLVGIEDFTAFARTYGDGRESCHDYNNNGTTDLTDFSLLAEGWGLLCP